jgi:cellulose synthase/poly-beta-1,6-N-acetylglucosamine synthase-like glycosyltransferase
MKKRMLMRRRLLALLLGLTTYAYAGYPIVLWIVGRFRNRPVRKGDVTPTVAVIIAAYNEERIIARKLRSVLEQDYPRAALSVLVASDGSSDATNRIVAELAERDDRLRLLALPRGGKAATLNAAAAEARGEIFIFTDANAMFAPGALRALLRNFADSDVGGVSANERRDDTDANSVGLGERVYWEYDKWLKSAESRVGSMVSASGSCYAIRSALFRPITDPAATDDFTISTQVVRAGLRLVFEPEAVTLEPPPATGEIEFNRKVRIVTRGLRSVYGIRELLLPWRGGFYALQVWSHKIVRRLVPFFAIGIFALTLSLVRRPFERLLVAGQVALYGLAAVGWAGRGRPWGRNKLLYIPYYFCLSNIAAMLGVLQFVRQRKLSVWTPRREA